MESKLDRLPKAFVWRRLHSLTGLWFVVFLLEHLITNSQAALLIGDNGQGFVRMVNFIHSLPYLTVIEVALLGVPILIHMFWGAQYARTSKGNASGSDGSKPYLKYSRNRAYSWQRITSYILLVLVVVHVVKFRFIQYPHSVGVGTPEATYFVKVTPDPGLQTVADRLGVTLYTGAQAREVFGDVKLKGDQLIAAADSFGMASLMTVRNTFKNPWWIGVYTIFVLSACFHAFNGLWTSMLTWGWVIKTAAQKRARLGAYGLMIVIALLGLMAVWGTYYLNLRG